MDDHHHWSFGDTLVIRGVLKGKLWWACPVYAVQDEHELTVFYWPAGTPTLSPIRRPTVRDELINHIQLERRKWTDNNVLSLNPLAAGYSIQVMWPAGKREMVCWYVHLQEALRRTRVGFDTMDQMLDIVISPDRSDWHWKDEDEFNEAGAIGLYSAEKMRAIRAEGEKVISMMEANASPFCDGWENWLPPAEWGIPQFPEDWEKIPL